MHRMDNTPRIITIIGLVFEGVGALGVVFGAYILANFQNFSLVNAESMEVTQAEFDEIIEVSIG